MKALLVGVLCLCVTTAAQAGELTAGEKKAAEIASWATMSTALASDALSCVPSPNPKHCFIMMGIRNAVTGGAIEGLKLLTKQPRPCAGEAGCDGYGWPSGHTAFTMSTFGGASAGVSITLTVGTGAGRMLANKHTLWQVLGGAAVGLVTSRIR